MVQLQVLAGTDAGTAWLVNDFPCVIGRSDAAHLRIEEPGVWDRHLELGVSHGHGFTLTVLPGALATVNGYPVEEALLRNGDIIDLGAAKLQFTLAPTRQRSFRLREALTWVALGIISAGQILLIYALAR